MTQVRRADTTTSRHAPAGTSGTRAGTATPCRIGIWGTFDLPGFDVLVSQVLHRELARRLPAARITAAAPYGRLRPSPRDGGEPAQPLGPWSPEGAASQALDLDCIVVAGADLLPDGPTLAALYGVEPAALQDMAPGRFFVDGPGEDAETGCPVFWLGVSLGADPTAEEADRLRRAAARRPYITVVDDVTRRRLAVATGVDAGIDVVPDVALLAPRLHPPELLAKRLEYLRLMGWYPREGAPLVVEGDRSLLPHAGALAGAINVLLDHHPNLQVVLAEMGADGDGAFAAALAERLPAEATTRLPGHVGMEDLAAALSSCAAFAGSSYRAGLLAFAYDRPLAILNLAGAPRLHQLEGLADLVGRSGSVVIQPADLIEVLDLALAAAAASPAGVLVPGTGMGPHTGRLATLTRQVDASLDGLAELAERATLEHGRALPGTSNERLADLAEHLHRLEVAFEARSRRMATERMVFAEHLRKAEAEIARLRAESLALRTELDAAQKAAEGAGKAAEEGRRELEALRATRTFRYTAELRNVYGKLRGDGDPPQ